MKAKLVQNYYWNSDTSNKFKKGDEIEIDDIQKDDGYENGYKIHVINGLPDCPTWLSIDWILPE